MAVTIPTPRLPQLPRLSFPRWVWVVLGVLCLALLIWFVGPLVSVAGKAPLGGWIARLVVIALLVAGVAGWYVLKRVRAKRANDAMVRDLAAPAADKGPPQEDLSAEDIRAMEERAAKALELMRSTRVGKDREFVYQLPWYVIIGPPGAGKTTALQNSGLNFPVAQELGAAPLRGIGGTRTTEWWFTDEAVLIDTAGRYTTQDSHEAADAKSWNGFLDLLKRYRPRQPLTGVLVSIAATDLVSGDEEQVAAHGRAVRQRINEITAKFGVRTPVYVLLTKLDLLAGFDEFFDDLDANAREQVWGTTFPAPEGSAAATLEPARAGTEFDALVGRLNDRLLSRVQAERDMARRSQIFGFPQQFASLREPLMQLLGVIGRDTRMEPAPMLRGFYLTSGTQHGRPLDRLLSSITRQFGVEAQSGGGQGARGRSYFLPDLLNKVVFAEAALAGRDPAAEKRRRNVRLAVIAGCSALLLLLTLGWVYGFLANARLTGLLAKRGSEVQQAAARLRQGEVSDSDLLPVLPVLDGARGLPFASTAPRNLRSAGFSFGVGRAASLRPQVDGAYRNLLNRQMLPRLILALEDRLRSLTAAGGAPEAKDARAEIYALLRVYLMLGRSPGAPMHKDQVAGWWSDAWADRFPGQEDDPVRASLEGHLDTLLSGPLQPPALDRDLIAQARGLVAGLSPGERVYTRLLTDGKLRELPPYTLVDVPGVGASGLFARKSGKPLSAGVPGMFRKGAFYSSVMPAIGQAAIASADENWVTGEPAQGSSLAQAGAIKDGILVAYLNDFTRQWDDFINDIGVSGQQPPDERIRRALRPPSPVKQLMTSLAAETDLTPPASPVKAGGLANRVLRTASIFSRRIYSGYSRVQQVGQAAGGGAPSPPGPLDEVIDHYRWLRELIPAGGPSPLDDALEALKSSADSTLAAKAASGMGDPLLQKDKLSSAMAATSKLKETAAVLPPVAGALFTGFVSSTTSQLNQGARSSIQQAYGQQLLPECKSILAMGYPFAPGERQATVDDFSRLFRPGGLIDQFQITNLAGQVDSTRRPWTLSPSGKALGLGAGVVRQLELADTIRRTYFKPGDVRPNVRFVLEPVAFTGGASTVTLSVDGTPAAFETSQRKAVELRWPAAMPGVTLSFQGAGGAAPATRSWTGDWALHRMLQDAKVTGASSGGLTFEIGVAGQTARFRMRMMNTPNPFGLGAVRQFQCPSAL